MTSCENVEKTLSTKWRACEHNEGLDVEKQTHEVGALLEVS